MTKPNPSLDGGVLVQAGNITLEGDLTIPAGAPGIVVFAHGSGSGRFSRRNRQVALTLNNAGLATLLFDLLTLDEQVVDEQTRALRFDIPLLARRLVGAVDWVSTSAQTKGLPIGLFGASTGAAAALVAAAERPAQVGAVVSRGGRPDLAGAALPRVAAPTLLIVGGADMLVLELNQAAARHMKAPCHIEIVPGATHLFEEPGALEEVARQASEWFTRHLDS